MNSRRAEGNIEWRGRSSFRVRVAAGRDPLTGKPRWLSRTGKGDKKGAEQALRDLLHERDRGVAIEPAHMTVGDWLGCWLTQLYANGHICLATHERYLLIVEKHIVPRIGALKLHDLRSDHVASLKREWLSGEGSTSRRPLAVGTVHKQLKVLREALNAAVASRLLTANPAIAVSMPSLANNLEQRALSEEEITQLLCAARGTEYYIPIGVSLATGIREGELLALRWRDVDLEAGTAFIRGTKSAKSYRLLELSDATVRLLRAHHAVQAVRRLQLDTAWDEDGLVFPSILGTPWLRSPFYRGYRALVDGSGLCSPQTVKWHTLRHTAASQWLRHGADIFAVSRRLGHASAAFTMDTYAHLLKGQQRQAAEALDHLIQVA